MSDWHESLAKAECRALRLRVRELEAENEQLRKICDRDAATANRLFPENLALEAENERLRAVIDDRIATDTYAAAMQLMDDLK